MSASLLPQRNHVAVAAITSSRQQLLESSMFRSSSLALPSCGRFGDFTRLGRSSPIKRHVSSGVAIRSVELSAIFKRSDKKKKENIVKPDLELHIHRIRPSGPNDTTATVKELPESTEPSKWQPKWGSSYVFDNEVRAKSDKGSQLWGRERGWGIVSSMDGKEGLQLLSKISFTHGDHEGSSLTFQGNVGGKGPNELLILGGTGDFRGMHGYALVDEGAHEGRCYKFHWKVFFLK